MITAVHALIYSRQADAVRAFLRDTLGWDHVDSGNGWLIFALPPAELGVHPTDGPSSAELYLMCDDIDATCAELRRKGVATSAIQEQPWGRVTQIRLPSGAELGMYEPKHPVAIARG